MNLDLKFLLITIIVILVFIIVIVGLIGWIYYINGNKILIDYHQSFNTAYIEMPDGTPLKIRIKSWKDYENSDSIQLIDIKGTPIYTHLNRVILTKEAKSE